MATEAQIAANRRNALASTGPRTNEGLAASSANATRHGLTSGFRVLTNESQEEFDALVAEYHRIFAPTNIHERFLVEELAQARWRLARARRIEATVYENLTFSPDNSEADWHFVNALSTGSAAPFYAMQRYMAAAERTSYKALKHLNALRNAGATPSETCKNTKRTQFPGNIPPTQ